MSYKELIKEVIELSSFVVAPQTYKYHLVSSYLFPEKHLQIIHLNNETTVVTEVGNEKLLNIQESNPEYWKLIKIKCGKPFYCVGFIASISSALAEEGIDITFTSTYEFDLLLVQESNLDSAVEILINLGFKAD